MQNQATLFDDIVASTPHYPDPGHRHFDTSVAAAKSVECRTRQLHARILHFLDLCRDLTPDECAEMMGESVLSIRPRFTELKLQGLIRDTGERRKNHSGRTARVWRRA